MEESKYNLPEVLPQDIHLMDYMRVVLKRKWTLMSFCVIIVTVVTINTFKMKPIYKSTVQILIEAENPIIDFQQAQADVSDTYYQTQYKILKSRWLAGKTLEKLKSENVSPIFSSESDNDNINNQIDSFLSLIDVEPVRGSQLVNISVRSYSPELAAKIANVIAQTYIESDMETKLGTARNAMGWLSEELKDAEEKVKNSKNAQQQYVANNRFVVLESNLAIATDKISILSRAITEAKAKEMQLVDKYREFHPARLRLISEIKLLEENLKRALDEQQQVSLELEQKKVEYAVLQNEVETNLQMYTALLTRLKETDITRGIKTGNIRIIDMAEPPRIPFLPNKQKNIIIALVISFFSGICFIFFLEYLDDTLKTEEDVKQYLKLNVLGHIPTTRLSKEKTGKYVRHIYSFTHPKSNMAEAFRNIRTRILATSYASKFKKIVVTSSSPEEGKSFSSTNLSITMAQMGTKVLLIEGDLRRPVFKKIFNLDKTNGLSDYLVGKVEDINSVIHQVLLPTLNIIPCGNIPHNPAELLVSPKMRDLCTQLENSGKFDYIVFDCPPSLSVADTTIIASLSDVVVYVVRAGKMKRRVVQTGKDKLEQVGAKILGAIFNDIDMERGGYYYSGYYYHYRYGYGYGENTKKRQREEEKEKSSIQLSSK